MTPNQDPAATIQIVTISREYGSGGGEIAARLAERLGWRLVDHEVIAQVAQALGVARPKPQRTMSMWIVSPCAC